MSAATAAPAVRPAASGFAGRGRRHVRRSRSAITVIPRASSSSSSSSSSSAKPDGDSKDAAASAAASSDALSRRLALGSAAALVALPNVAPAAFAAEPLKSSFYDYTVEQYGKPFDLGAFKGDVTVVLNVASEWRGGRGERMVHSPHHSHNPPPPHARLFQTSSHHPCLCTGTHTSRARVCLG